MADKDGLITVRTRVSKGLAKQVEIITKEQNKSVSQVLRDALENYAEMSRIEARLIAMQAAQKAEREAETEKSKEAFYEMLDALKVSIVDDIVDAVKSAVKNQGE